MSAFTTAVRSSVDPSQGVLRTYGENGMPELTVTGHGYTPLAYFEKTCRDLAFESHLEFIDACIREATSENDPTKVVELFLMMMQVRDCRGGKGDKLPFYNMMQIMFARFPATTMSLIENIPHYGYWKDLLLLVKHVTLNPFQGVDYSPLIDRCYAVMAKGILEDDAKLKSGSTELSFVGKFAPREDKEFEKNFRSMSNIIKNMYPEDVGSSLRGKSKAEIVAAWNRAKGKYRRVVVPLATALNVPEQFMCSMRWQEINFARVTSLCMSRNMNAFLNQTKDGQVKHPGSQDRILCAEHVIENLSKLSGKVLNPHELVTKVLNNHNLTPASKAVISAQWNKVREGTVEQAAAQSAEEGKETFQLSALVPIGDVSGSMHGIPKEVCIALSLLLSEITHKKFRDLILTFSSDCRWEDFSDCTTFVDKVYKLSKMHWGMSTNFVLAMQRIAKIVEDNGLTSGETPNLVVFSDMQFDAAFQEQSYYGSSSSSNKVEWSTMHEKIVAMFHDLGMRMDGAPRPAPKIVFWNLRSDTVGYPAEATQPGVVTMSGYNPSLMKFFLTGQLDGEEVEVVDEETGEIKTVRREITPLESFKNVMSDSRLDLVRAKLVNSSEGILAKFGTDVDPNEATLFE